jgi:phage anti-repressor protein
MNLGITEIIPLREERNGERTVDARDLHSFLENGDQFANWIRERIKSFDFEEGADYVTFLANAKKGRPTKEYHLSIGMAKELAMVERNKQGKKARRYFLACEKALQAGRASLDGASAKDLADALTKKLWDPYFYAGYLHRVLPLHPYGSPGKNGKPRVGFRRSAYTETPGRAELALELSELPVQFCMLDILKQTQPPALSA